MAIDRGRLEELRRKRDTEGLTRAEAAELDRLQARSEKRESLAEEEEPPTGLGRLPFPPD